MAKLWMVNVSLDFTMAVVAETAEEAEDIAADNWRDEPAADEIDVCADECTKLPRGFEGSIPWGGDGDATCETYLTGEES